MATNSTTHRHATLWIGDLQQWMNEDYLRSCFSSMPVLSTKVIKNKLNGHSEGYGFIEFPSREDAEKALQAFQGTPMPQWEQQAFRLNWASFGLGDKRDSGDHSIFVGDLAPDVDDTMLLETFKTRYPSVKAAKVVTDSVTGRSRSYGFVRFGDDVEKNQAMAEMNGEYCSTRPMRISVATPRKGLPPLQMPMQMQMQMLPKVAAPFQPLPVVCHADDPANKTIFVGNLDRNVTDVDLRNIFSKFGDISYVKIPPNIGCGFVHFESRASAEEALDKVNGTVIGQQQVRLSWGRNTGSKPPQRVMPAHGWMQPQYDVHQWYYYNPDGYGYVYPQDPGFSYGYQGTYPQQVN